MADSKTPRKPRTIRPLPNQAEFDRLMERAAKVNGMSKNSQRNWIVTSLASPTLFLASTGTPLP